MPDDAVTRESIIAVSFTKDANAYEALSRVKELDGEGEVGVRGAAVVVRGEDGKIATNDQFGDQSLGETASGGLLGLVIGFSEARLESSSAERPGCWSGRCLTKTTPMRPNRH